MILENQDLELQNFDLQNKHFEFKSTNPKENDLTKFQFSSLLKKEHQCTICTGILQYCDKPETLKFIADQVKQNEYEFDSFKFSVKVPLSTNLREFHASLVQNNFKDDSEVTENGEEKVVDQPETIEVSISLKKMNF